MERKAKGYRISPIVVAAVKKDADKRGFGEAEWLEMLLAAYYGISELLVDQQRMEQARVVLQIAEHFKEDFQSPTRLGGTKKR